MVGRKSLVACLVAAVAAAGRCDFASYVDPFIGTSATGHTFPGACVPFGLVQASPDTATGDWDHCSGYRSSDEFIRGFSQTHLNGTGCADLGDVLIQPFVAKNWEDAAGSDLGCMTIPSRRADETAHPGYYAVTLADFGVRVEATASERTAIYRIHYPPGSPAKLLVDAQWGIAGELPLQIMAADVRPTEDWSGVDGWVERHGWVERRYAFSLGFDHPAVARACIEPKEGECIRRWVFSFDLEPGVPLLVRVGMSAVGRGGAYATPEAARANAQAEIPDWNFDRVRDCARAAWNDVLSSAVIEGSDEQRTTWYTSLYHLFIQPNIVSDAGDEAFYSTFSCWDTFRAAGPLYTILAPGKAAEFVLSMLEQGRRTGYLPIWPLWGEESQCMIGTHSVPMIVDWILKTSAGPDGRIVPSRRSEALAAFEQIKETLTRYHPLRVKEDWNLYDKHGYYPFDEIKGESVSRTMECAYDDECAARLARALGLEGDAAFFRRRAGYWKNVFDPGLGLVRGRDSSGKWREPFNPFTLGWGAETANDFTEGNAFQYTWHVLHDPAGLVEAMGGRDSFVERLDSLFEAPRDAEGMGSLPDVTGLVGQYVHGNEPSHHVIPLYSLVGERAKAAERMREVVDRFYRPEPDGLCGNDDCGQMSAWYIFNAMGFYPVDPCGGEYVVGAPQVPKATIRLKDGKTFTVEARNLSRENKYVKSVELNGRPLVGPVVRHCDIMNGGSLVFEMAAEP